MQRAQNHVQKSSAPSGVVQPKRQRPVPPPSALAMKLAVAQPRMNGNRRPLPVPPPSALAMRNAVQRQMSNGRRGHPVPPPSALAMKLAVAQPRMNGNRRPLPVPPPSALAMRNAVQRQMSDGRRGHPVLPPSARASAQPQVPQSSQRSMPSQLNRPSTFIQAQPNSGRVPRAAVPLAVTPTVIQKNGQTSSVRRQELDTTQEQILRWIARHPDDPRVQLAQRLFGIATRERARYTGPIAISDPTGIPRLLGSDIGPGVGLLQDRQVAHFNFGEFQQLKLRARLQRLGQIVSHLGPDIFMAQQQQMWPSDEMLTVFRYHKFPLDSPSQQLVFGGGFNKMEITPEWSQKSLTTALRTRHKMLTALVTPGSGMGGEKRARLMEKFQASAMDTPFIATTVDLEYTKQLFEEYPPEPTQRAVILAIQGPRSHFFDFESEFEALGALGGGQEEWNWRTRENRAKDMLQREFGIPDVFIPMQGASPSGFKVVKVINLNSPSRTEVPNYGISWFPKF